MVITSALHAEGPRFEPEQKQFFLFFFIIPTHVQIPTLLSYRATDLNPRAALAAKSTFTSNTVCNCDVVCTDLVSCCAPGSFNNFYEPVATPLWDTLLMRYDHVGINFVGCIFCEYN